MQYIAPIVLASVFIALLLRMQAMCSNNLFGRHFAHNILPQIGAKQAVFVLNSAEDVKKVEDWTTQLPISKLMDHIGDVLAAR